MPNFVCASETSEWISSAISREEKEYYLEVFERGDVRSWRTVRSARRPETLPSAVADASNADDSFERPATGSSRSAPPGRPVAFDPKELSGGWRWGDGHPMSFSLAAVAAATAARAPVPRAAARSRRDGAPKISARTRQVRASASRTLPSPAAPKRASSPHGVGCPRAARRDNLLRGASGGFGGRRRGPASRRAGRHRRVPARAETSASSPPRPRSATSPPNPRDAD